MSQHKHVQTYANQQVLTSSPAKLVYMLYDRALLSLQEAIDAIERKDVKARWKANKRAMDIVGHMWETLDVDKGGEIADNLAQLFGFIMRRLVYVDLHNDAAPAREAITLLTPLRDSWKALALTGGSGETAARPAASEASTDQPQPLRASLSA